MCICPLCICCISGGHSKVSDRRQLQDLSLSHSFWPSHLTAGLSAPTHTLSLGKCHSAAPSTSSFLLTPCSPSPLSPPRLTPLWMPVASSHGADDSRTPVSVFLSLPVHSVVTTEHNGITANGSLIFFSFFMLLCFL